MTTDESTLHRPDDGLGTSSLVPPRRLGALLSETRELGGVRLDDVVARSAGAVTAAELTVIESGGRLLDDTELRSILGWYGLDADGAIPSRSRLVVDLDGGFMNIDEHRARLGRRSGRREVLVPRYLSLVYTLRGASPGERVPLRADDLDVLGRALRIGADAVAADLEALMVDPKGEVTERMRLLSRRVFVPAAGILVGLCGLGTVLLVADGSSAAAGSSDSSAVTAPVDVEIGTAVVQERLADGTPGPVEERQADE